MRRFAAVFSSKRSDTQEEPSSTAVRSGHFGKRWGSKRFNSVSSPESCPTSSTAPSTPQLTPSDRGKSSASSSSGSTGLRTPDDDTSSSRTFSAKPSWPSWISRKRSTYFPAALDGTGISDDWNARNAPILQPAPLGKQRTLADTEDETTSESDNDSESCSLSASLNAAPLKTMPVMLTRARDYLRVITSNKLIPTLSSPPLLHLPGTHRFPRSCNAARFLHFSETLESSMRRRQLIRQLETTLGETQETSILSLGSRPLPTMREARTVSEDTVLPDAKRTSSFCPGLRRWISRKPFEQRMLSWTKDDSENDDIVAAHVKGTALGVPEIEFSHSLESLAGIFVDEDSSPVEELDFLLEPEPPTPPSSNSSHLSVTGDTRKVPYTALPSPLRMQHGPVSPQLSPSSSGLPDQRSTATLRLESPSNEIAHANSMPDPPPPKRGVHFVEDDMDDNIPLGYIIRMKKRRQDKERFLQTERERRAFEQERRKVEEERKLRESERTEWERERKAWEREKKQMEEERKRRVYAEEIAAARARRDSVRAGNGVSSPNPLPRSEPDHSKSPDVRQHRGPFYSMSNRRQSINGLGGSTSHSPNPGPTASSRSSNTSKPARSPGSGHRRSQPPSMHIAHSSMEDLRLHDENVDVNWRGSMATTTDRSSIYSTWSTGNMPHAPAMPVFPVYMNMPLLPPTPPFMLQQHLHPVAPVQSISTPKERSMEQVDQRQRPPSKSFSSPSPSPRPPSSRHRSSQTLSAQQRPSAQPNHHRYASDGHEGSNHSSALNQPAARSSSQPVPMESLPWGQHSQDASFVHPLPHPHPWMTVRALSQPTVPSRRPNVS